MALRSLAVGAVLVGVVLVGVAVGGLAAAIVLLFGYPRCNDVTKRESSKL